MAAPALVFSGPAGEFIAALLGEREVQPRAQIIASEIAERFPSASVIVYILDHEARCAARAHQGEVKRPRHSFEPRGTTLEPPTRNAKPVIYAGAGLARERFQHLDLRRSVESLAYLPMFLDEVAVGAVEIISFDRRIDADELSRLRELADFSALALAAAIAYESERNTQLQTISRLTQLYDLERSFNSTLQIEQLMPLITSKVQDVLDVQAVNLWMVEEDGLILMSQSGDDPTVSEGDSSGPGVTIAKEVADTAKSVLARNSADPRLQARNGQRNPAPLHSVLAVPIVSQNFQVGVLEVVNKNSGAAFDDKDAFYLATISITAGAALHNASLLEAERKIEILETLVKVSQEITSTLNLERVLQVIVNGSQRIVNYDRAAVAMQQFGSMQVRAISGKTDIVQQDPAVRQLRDTMSWAAVADGELYIAQHGDRIDADREEARQKFKDHFAATGYRGWYSVRLEDDQGRLGVLSFESKNPDFLSGAHLEFIKVVASQATVAIRNASLYKEVPLIGVLEPLIQKKQQFAQMHSARSLALGAAAALAVIFIAVPLPMRVVGDASVAPLSTAHIQAVVPGVISKVYVHEGDRVKQGQALADLDDWQYRSALVGAQAKYNAATSAMNAALASNNGTEAGIKRIEADYWNSEIARARDRLQHTHLVAPFDGTVVGPDLDTFTGRQLDSGAAFCDVVDTSHARVDVDVDEDEMPLLKGGETAAIKLEAYPLQTFDGRVTILSPTSVVEGEHRTFVARIDVPNGDQALRGGMRGRGKIKVGWRPSGYVIFRGFATWMWAKLWGMFGG